jgi:hypothetical protein
VPIAAQAPGNLGGPANNVFPEWHKGIPAQDKRGRNDCFMTLISQSPDRARLQIETGGYLPAVLFSEF